MPSRPSRTVAALGRSLAELLLPLAIYYLLRRVGFAATTSLLAASVPPLLLTVATMIRRRRVEVLGAVVVISLVLSAVVSLMTGSARMMLIRDAWVSLPLSAITLWSLRWRRPLCFVLTRSLLLSRQAIMDQLWISQAGFRRAWVLITWCWGATGVADAVIKVAIAYLLPVDVVPAAGTVVTVVSVAVLQLPTHLLLHRSGHWRQLFGHRWYARSLVGEPDPDRLRERGQQAQGVHGVAVHDGGAA